MRHTWILPAFMACCLSAALPAPAAAISLVWSTGTAHLGFAQATRCTLVVQAGPGEASLPGDWVLRWTADHAGVLKPQVDSSSTDASLAGVHDGAWRSTAEERAHVWTTTMQAPGSAFVTSARYVFDLPAGSSGKFEVVANGTLESGGSRIERSNVATFNGSVSAPLPPAIVSAVTDDHAGGVSVSLRGAGLGATSSLVVVGPDDRWRVPLQVSATDDSTVTATSSAALPLEDAALELRSESGAGSAASLLATACGATAPLDSLFNYVLFADPVAGYSTKDFAFHQNITKTTHKRLYHLFYIRHKDSDGSEPGLGHAWSADLRTWRVDLAGLSPGIAGDWDSRSVWAPHIAVSGDSTYMFYAGVDQVSFDQSIGYAATTDLDTCNTDWKRYRTPTWTVDTTKWAARRRLGGRQLRDPFVLPHPDSAGVFFLLFSQGDTNTVPSSTASLVGLARNRTVGSLQRWLDLGFYRNTGIDSTGFALLEGPMLMHDRASSTQWWMLFSNFNSECSQSPQASSIRFQRLDLGAAPWDTTSSLWRNPRGAPALFSQLAPDSTVWGWNGTEHLKDLDDRELLAGFTAWGQPRGGVCGVGTQGIAISQMHWRAPGNTDFVLRRPGAAAAVTAVDEDGSAHAAVRMSMVEFRPRSGRVSWRLEVSAPLMVRMDIYDIMGRVSRTLLDGRLDPGTTTVTWDTSNSAGAQVRSGMYYAKLSFSGGVRLATVPIVR